MDTTNTPDAWTNEWTSQFLALARKHAPDLTLRASGSEHHRLHSISLYWYRPNRFFLLPKGPKRAWEICRKHGNYWTTRPFERGWEAIRIWVYDRDYYAAAKALGKDYKRTAGKKAVVLLRDEDWWWREAWDKS